jgi:hypothetical protein
MEVHFVRLVLIGSSADYLLCDNQIDYNAFPDFATQRAGGLCRCAFARGTVSHEYRTDRPR